MSTCSVARISAGAAGAAAVMALVAACASSSSSAPPAGGGGSGHRTVARSSSTGGLRTRSTSIGTVLVDSAGRTVYELVGDSPAKQTCHGTCLAIWPAVRENGHQVVVNGHPAFTYFGDKSPGQTNGQHLEDHWGIWLALNAEGNPIGAAST